MSTDKPAVPLTAYLAKEDYPSVDDVLKEDATYTAYSIDGGGQESATLLIAASHSNLPNWFRVRAKLQLAAPHRFTFLVQEPLRNEDGDVISPNQTVHTASHVLTNAGRETATKVELVFNWRPLSINIWPSRHHEDETEQDGRYVMIFESLAPGEQIGFELLSVKSDLPSFINARSDQCTTDTVDMYPQPVVATWKRRLAVGLLFLGFAAAIYIAVVTLQFLILGTPYGH